MDKCQEFKFVKKHRKLKMLALSTVSSRRQGLMLNEMPSFFFFYLELATCLTLRYGYKQLLYGLFNKNGV